MHAALFLLDAKQDIIRKQELNRLYTHPPSFVLTSDEVRKAIAIKLWKM